VTEGLHGPGGRVMNSLSWPLGVILLTETKWETGRRGGGGRTRKGGKNTGEMPENAREKKCLSVSFPLARGGTLPQERGEERTTKTERIRFPKKSRANLCLILGVEREQRVLHDPELYLFVEFWVGKTR